MSSRPDDWSTFESLVHFLNVFWSRRMVLFALTAVGGIIALVWSFLVPEIYRAEVSILPQGNGGTAGLLGSLTSMIGAPVGINNGYEPLYSEIILSDRILDQAMERNWQFAGFDEPVSLYEIFDVDADGESSPLVRKDDLKSLLRSRIISFWQDKQTRYMVLSVTSPEDGRFAADLANFLVAKLEEFNLALRKNQATEQFGFLQQRLNAVEEELKKAENQLTEFALANSSYTSSPNLVQRYGELQREVQAQSSIWVELKRQMEVARIEANKDNTSVVVLDYAQEPAHRSSPDRFLYLVAGLLLGLMVGVLAVLVRIQVQAMNMRPDAELTAGVE